ncbi:MAG: helix-turn-helix domain-containing protein [Bacteroidota bacterium]|nr:helix-turn-helix domain-containing protein [Bacteroidota bacterium]
MAGYTEIAAEESFAGYIRKFWLLDNSASPLISPGKYALPNGCVTIAFISGNSVSVDFEKHAITVKPGIYFIGQIRTKVAVSLEPYTKAIMAQLNPWTPSLITKAPLYELTDNIIPLADLNSNLYSALSKQDLSDEKLLITELYKALESHIYSSTDFALIRTIFNELNADPLKPPVKVSDIARKSGYSSRLIEQKFNHFIGLPPKEMQRILQLRALIDELVPGHKPTLSALAHKYGYFDQSHFIKSYHKIMLDQPRRFDPANFILPLN